MGAAFSVNSVAIASSLREALLEKYKKEEAQKRKSADRYCLCLRIKPDQIIQCYLIPSKYS